MTSSVGVVPRPTVRPKRMRIGSRAIVAAIFLAPLVLVFAIFKYYPMLDAFRMSVYDWDMANPPGRFIGLAGFATLFNSSYFWTLFGNTLVLFALGMIIGFWVPIIQALLVNEVRAGSSALRFLYLVPAGIPPVGALLIWRYIWDPNVGLANGVLAKLGIPAHSWLFDPELVKFCLRFPAILGGGMGFLIFYAAICNLSAEMYESAAVDGANAWQRMWKITLPNLYPIIGIMFVMNLAGSLLAFDDVMILTNGGPGYSSATLVYGLYKKAFQEFNFGAGACIGVIIFVCSLALVALQLRLMKPQQN